ncbi:hypothetical protein NDU88_005552 [Pleurodeles waltl]|uniref:Uncharacterized protein n=1 Tax=Pleurodeles waltl TaxID=8319 RepID=A0AAV7W854_PLEWA|nr:hypothetical protein NDU88_005552 [Pleurodeles waltl]
MGMTYEDCTDFLTDILLQVLSLDDREMLEADLSEEELMHALRKLQSGKAQGPNGLQVEMYKSMASVVAKLMLAMF